MEERADTGVGVLRMATLAALSIVTLIAISTWQAYSFFSKGGRTMSAKNPTPELSADIGPDQEFLNWQGSFEATPSDPDGLSNIAENVTGAILGSYTTLSESGAYTPEEGERIAGTIADTLRAKVSYRSYAASDIATDADTSHERMLSYRSDLRVALEPLLQNPGYEFKLFAQYLDSKDETFRSQLAATVENYRAAIEHSAKVVVPADAVEAHVEVLNAMSEFAATLERMTEYADDAFATTALLRTYNETEMRVLKSFDALAAYYATKRS